VKRVMWCVVFLVCLTIGVIPVMAHPGRTDSNGCHTCRTNCASWGLRNGEYHCHNGNSSSSSSSSGSSSSSQSRSSQKSTINYVYGCTNKNSINYNSNANRDDGSCIAIVRGCMDKEAYNYNEKANKDDGSCIAKKYGCMDSSAVNFDSSSNIEDDSCQYKKEITKTIKIKYQIKYRDNNDLIEGNEKIVIKGKNGKKKITYDAIVDKNGKVISKEIINEEVLEKPISQVIERGTQEPSSIPALLWIISLAISFWYSFKNKDGNLLLNKISRTNQPIKAILYIAYVMLVIPAFIDIVLVIINLIRKLLKR